MPSIAPLADWPQLYAEWKAQWEPAGESIAAFARAKNLKHKTVEGQFRRREIKASLDIAHARNKSLLLKSQTKVAAALDAENVEPDFALKVFKTVFEREEPNAGLAQQTNIIVPPMFASPAAQAAMEALMRPPADSSEPSKAQEAAARLMEIRDIEPGAKDA
ncbi:hypothetical protein KGP36_02310 [Patescibacteria group bacterium]|nr:hypothetical protein [Patescibacteria group bacterium]